MKWINVKDKLPDEYENIILYAAETDVLYPMICIGYYHYDHFEEDNGATCDNVTHWMPLPKPP